MPDTLAIRRATESDWPKLWPVVRDVSAAGETYPYPMDISEAEARRFWMELPRATFLAENSEREVLGTYYLKPNQPYLGDHVANAGYMVAEKFRGRGVGRALCEHSITAARQLGFRALQFNLVIAENTAAVALYQKLGFDIVGKLPQAFRLRDIQFVDALVMYRLLPADS